MIRLALVGAGKWGQNYIRAALDSGVAEVTDLVGRADRITRDVDAVVIATPPWAHLERCAEALALGLPVLVEKPATLSLVDAQGLEALEAVSDAFVLVGHQHLFAEGYEALRAQGTPQTAYAEFCGPVRRDYPEEWDYGAHAVACLLGLGMVPGARNAQWSIGIQNARVARVTADGLTYDAYESRVEPPLTSQVRAFANAVKSGGTDDYRFGARWAVDVANCLIRL